MDRKNKENPMTDNKDMPDVIYAYEDTSQGYGGNWFSRPAPVDDGSDTVKYHRPTKDTITIPMEELEGMRKDRDYYDYRSWNWCETKGHNNLIDKLIKEYGE